MSTFKSFSIFTFFLFIFFSDHNHLVGLQNSQEEHPNQKVIQTANQVCSSYQSMSIANFEVHKNKTIILLNNGVLCEYYDTDLFTQPGGWESGDIVQIVYVYTGGYYLKNISFQGQIPIKILNPESKDIQSLTITTIKKIPSKNDKAKSNDYQITLEDNSEWSVGWWSGQWMEDWTVGDRILVTFHDFIWGEANTLLINLDRTMFDPFYSWSSLLCSNVRAHQKWCVGIEPPEIQFPKLRPTSYWKLEINNISFADGFFLIELNNGTVWKSTGSINLKHWEIGKEVFFNSGSTSLKLVNSQGKSINVAFLKFVNDSINHLTIQKVLKHGNKLILSDGSIWFKNTSKRAFQNWKENDRIIISTLQSSNYDTSSHLLINLDKLHNVKEHPNLLSHHKATLIR